MAEKIQLSKQIVKDLVPLYISFRVHGTMNVCKTWLGLLTDSCYQETVHKQRRSEGSFKRHLEFFNTHPYVASPIIGVTLALRRRKS